MRRRHQPDRPRWPAHLPLVALAVATLVVAVMGGLLRAGVAWPASALGPVAPPALLAHGALMVAGFFATVIGLERAVALRHPLAFAAPTASVLGALALLAGWAPAACGLLVMASLAFAGVTALIVHRQRAAHTALLLVAAVCSVVANLTYATQGAPVTTLMGWLSFLVITIAAERLEMTRLTRRHPAAQPALFLIIGAIVMAMLLAAAHPAGGMALYGTALIALAAWMALFDIARRTVAAHGLPRYMAVALLLGYAWLAVGGACWLALAAGAPARDAALHALGLGFVFSMVMAHAPVILPAIARIKLRFSASFYAPLGLLHASLIVRLAAGTLGADWQRRGAALNALALMVFALTMAWAARAWRRHHGQER